MAFERAQARTPASIGNITIILRDPDGEDVNKGVRFSVDVHDETGAVLRTVEGDLAPHLTAGQKTALVDFMVSMRAQAETQILGV